MNEVRLRHLITSIFLTGSCVFAAEAEPQENAPAQEVAARSVLLNYPVKGLSVEYVSDHSDQLSIDELMSLEVMLEPTELGFEAPKSEGGGIAITLVALASTKSAYIFEADAIIAISQRIVAYYNEKGYVGVYVQVDPSQISPQGVDLRTSGQKDLKLLVHTYTVEDVRTIGLGKRFKEERPTNEKAHERIIDHAPINAGSMISREELDEYVAYLNRYPLRRVDVQLDPATGPDAVNVDFLVTEEKPWRIYASAMNTGSAKTSDWIERFGFTHYQTTDRDDILSLEYVTASFANFHSVIGSYEAPLFDCRGVRWNVQGSWSEFVASQFGQFDDEFTGRQYQAGLGISALLYQRQDLFIDLLANIAWHRITVINKLLGMTGEDDFFVPNVMLRLERRRDTSTIAVSLAAETNIPEVFRTDAENIELLGRASRDTRWWTLNGSAYLARYIDDIFGTAPARFPHDWHHEVSIWIDGQYAFDYRIIPQFERVLGGAHTVRGYPQSVIAGAHSLMGQGEYRFHIHRDEGHLILRAFVDAGMTWLNQKEFFEKDVGIAGAGVGAELQLKQNLQIRADCGFALLSLADPTVDVGNVEAHIMVLGTY